MIWKQFRQLQTNYTDTDKEIIVSCSQFYILDKVNSVSKPKDRKSMKKKNVLNRANSVKKKTKKESVSIK